MFKSKVFYIILILVIIGAMFFYRKYRVNKSNNQVAYFMQATSSQPLSGNGAGKNIPSSPLKLFGTLVMTSGIPNSQDMANGLLCIENSKNIDKVDLFMPDMGHGSEPPKVTPLVDVPKEFERYNKSVANFGCYSVESMQLFMPGTWQVRVFYKDGITGIFTIELKK